MEQVYNAVLVLHFIGLASLVGGCMVQMSAHEGRNVSAAMNHGALTMLVTGLALVGMAESIDSLDKDIDQVKIGVKLLVALVITVLCLRNRRHATVSDRVFALVFGLSLVNVVIAVFWS